MKFYGFVVGSSFNPIDDAGQVKANVKSVWTHEGQRNKQAEQAAMANWPEPVWLFECTGLVELGKPSFMKKKFSTEGELLPEKSSG